MTEVNLYKVINGGHTWPGSRSGFGLGNTNRDIDASLEIWKFFSGFSLHSTSSMRNEEKINYLLFPNPVGSIIYINSNEIIDLVEIVDLIGNIVKIYKEESINEIDVKNITPGVYFINLYSPSGLVSTERIIITL